MIVNVRGKGLVVLSSCSHSGAINVLRNAQRVTGVTKIHAFVGGLHLTGGLFEPIIPQTITELVAIGPDWVVPGHCTGWPSQSSGTRSRWRHAGHETTSVSGGMRLPGRARDRSDSVS